MKIETRGGKANRKRRRQVANLRSRGLSLPQIGKRLGVTYQAVYHLLRKTVGTRRPVRCRKCRSVITAGNQTFDNLRRKPFCLGCLPPAAGIGERLLSFRLSRGLTRQQLEKLADVSVAAIQRCETGRTKPKHENWARLAGALGLAGVLTCPAPFFLVHVVRESNRPEGQEDSGCNGSVIRRSRSFASCARPRSS